jgi:hypothetical protein
MPVDLKQLLDFVEHRLFGGIVRRAVLFRALEHQMLEVVGETGRL